MAKSPKPRAGSAAKPKTSAATRARKAPQTPPPPAPAVLGPVFIAADKPLVNVGQVEAGETWRFEANGRWRDSFIPCGPNGYRNFAADVLDIRPRGPDSNWFCLMGIVDNDEGSIFPIGQGCEHTFERSGTLQVFANDLPDRYHNNHGELILEGARLAGPLPRVDPWKNPQRFKGFVGKWRLIQLVAEQSSGVGLVAGLVLAVCFALAAMTQGRDLIRTIADDGLAAGPRAVWLQVAFCLGLLLFAVQAWIWPRMIILSNCGLDRARWGPSRRYLDWTPRVIATWPFIAAAVGLAATDDPDAWLLRGLVALTAVIFFGFVIPRRKIGAAIASRIRTAPTAKEMGRRWVIFTTLMGLAAMTAFIIWPVGLPRLLGAPTVVFIGIGLLIPWLVFSSQFGRIFRIPVMWSLLLIALVFSSFSFLDNHAVGRRAFADLGGPVERPVAPRMTLDQAYSAWKAQAPRDADGRPVMVLVASEGGASRAGFWTGEVLTALHEKTGGRLPRSLFAVSSVSGGSVGAVGYAAVLQDNATTPDLAAVPVGQELEGLTGADALSPVVAGLLFPDLLYRFLPLGVLPDRAEALERSWEVAWASGPRKSELTLDQPFLSLQPQAGQPWRPVLIVNGASEQTGRRVLTSTIELPPRVDAHDFHQLTGRDIQISSAIHNGARFPWVSPAGTLTQAGKPKSQAQGHIIDGGYFDSVGIEVLRELADAILQGPGKDDKLHIVFVIAAYSGQPQPNADAPAVETKVTGKAPAAPLELADSRIEPKWWLNELLTPARGFFASRDGHGYHMARELQTMVRQRTEPTASPVPAAATAISSSAFYAPALLCETSDFRNPMNWALSKRSQDHMRCAAGREPVDGEICRIDCWQTVETLSKVANIVNQARDPDPTRP